MRKFFLVFILSLLTILTNPYTSIAADCTSASGEIVCPAAGVIQVQELMQRMINISVGMAFIALTIWLAWAAIKLFITSGGEPKAIAQAWQAVVWAFGGILFMILAFLILKLIGAFTGVHVLENFCIGFPPYCAATI